MKDSIILGKSLYAVLALSILLDFTLLVLFGIDNAFAALTISLIGLIAGCVGVYGTWKKNFPALMVYSVMSFAWILLGIVHVAMISNLIKIDNASTSELFIGTRLANGEDEEADRSFRIIYPTIYAILITVTAVGMMLACLIPTPDGKGFRYPWMRSKANLNRGGPNDPYYEDYNQPSAGAAPFPYPFQAPMMLGLPAFPMAMPGQPQQMGMGMYGQQPPPPPMHQKGRSMPSVYDYQPGYDMGTANGYRQPTTQPQPPQRRKSNSSSSLSFDTRSADNAPTRGASQERRASAEFNGSRRRSSAADNYGFL